MSDSIMNTTGVSIDDILKYVKPQEADGELCMALAPTKIVNNCSSTLLWSQCWGGMVISYGCMSPGTVQHVSHDVRWYDYVFTFTNKSTTRVMVAAGSTLTLHDDDF